MSGDCSWPAGEVASVAYVKDHAIAGEIEHAFWGEVFACCFCSLSDVDVVVVPAVLHEEGACVSYC